MVNLQRAFKTRVLGRKPVPKWTVQPEGLQLDTTNARCPLDCVVCNPQRQFITERGKLPMPTIQRIADTVRRKRWKPMAIYPFMESDPLLENRLPKIIETLSKIPHTTIMLSTNGVLYSRRAMLNNPLVDRVSFTICASNAADYEHFHGKALFSEAMRTLTWLTQHGHEGLKIQVRYILIPDNADKLGGWRWLFRDYPQEVWAFHYSKERNVSSRFTHEYSKTVERYRWKRLKHFKLNQYPCNCFHDLAVSYSGHVMNCCDLPYDHNFGHVEEVDLQEVYEKRLELGLRMKGCDTCSNKNPEWRELFEKYVW